MSYKNMKKTQKRAFINYKKNGWDKSNYFEEKSPFTKKIDVKS